jgi:serine/threonine-protein kinase
VASDGNSEQSLLTLAIAVADGDRIDWDAVESAPGPTMDTATGQQLKILGAVSEFHRRRAAEFDKELAERTGGAHKLVPVGGAGALAPAASLHTWGRLEILEEVGEGSFGQVFRAWDPQLSRQVALKLLRHAGSARERGSAVIREASLMARVDHPNVVTIYGADVIDGQVGIWMEFIRGQSLEEILLNAGPFGAREAALIGSELCRAIAAIHRAGLVHRDLKAQNIMREIGGRLVVMDFGTGFDLAAGEAFVGPELPGTPLYAAPEVLEGQEATARNDVYSLGVLLFHLLTGSFPVTGRTIAEVQRAHRDRRGKLLQDVLPDLSGGLTAAIDRALHHDPAERFGSVKEMERHLLTALAGVPAVDAGSQIPCLASGQCALPMARRRWRLASTAAAAALSAVAVAATLWLGEETTRITRLVVPVAPAHHLKEDPTFDRPLSTALTVSPNGNRLAFVGQVGANRQIYMRHLSESTAEPLDETDGASSPAFSPDGAWLAYVTGNLIWKVPSTGGDATTVTEVVRRIRPPGSSAVVPRLAESDVYGLDWRDTTQIVFGRFAGGLWSVSAAGGTPTPLTVLNESEAEFAHRLPHILPGGNTVLFTVVSGVAAASTRLVAQSLISGERRVVIEDAADGRYVETGHLVFMRQGQLMAAAFDPKTASLKGSPVKLLDGVMQSLFSYRNQLNVGAAQFAFSRDGHTLAYVAGPVFPDESRSLVWVDTDGQVSSAGVSDGAYMRPDVAPDGRSALFTCWSGARPHVCAFDFDRRVSRRVTEGLWPLWSPDGSSIAFGRLSKSGVYNLFSVPPSGSPEPDLLLESPRDQWPGSWSPDGASLAYVETSPTSDNDIWILSVKDRKVRAFLRTAAREDHPEFSPDGRWMAYSSNESGREEVYVTEFPSPKTVLQVSTDGGTGPVWSRDGRQLFYAQAEETDGLAIMSVQVATDPRLTLSRPRRVIAGDYLALASVRSYDISADGRQFLLVRDPRDQSPVTHVNIVLNWDQELRAIGRGQ